MLANAVSRIIPARAGFTSCASPRPRSSSDHPRSRGVYRPYPVPIAAAWGSSPLARGLLVQVQGGVGGVRIIPARAGFTRGRPRTGRVRRDHPRSRGGYSCRRSFPSYRRGSSPLARGLPKRSILASSPGRIIPARAGFTGGAEVGPGGESDHPRSRGGYPRSPQITLSAPGSSPLARGLLP